MALLLMVAGCDEDPPDVKPDAPALEISFKHLWDGSSFNLSDWFVTANKDTFMASTLNYHINSFVFVDDEGKSYPQENFEFVNFESDGNKTFKFTGLEDKVIKKVIFTVGVEDSTMNADGELNDDFTDPMYWGMAMGYINVKLEGKYKDTSGGSGNVYFHIGGYIGNTQTARTIELELNTGLEQVLGKNTAEVSVDVAQFFHNPNTLDLSMINDVQTVGTDAVMISENWDSMFTISN